MLIVNGKRQTIWRNAAANTSQSCCWKPITVKKAALLFPAG